MQYKRFIKWSQIGPIFVHITVDKQARTELGY